MLYELSFVVMFSLTAIVLFFIAKRFMNGDVNGYFFVIPIFIFFYIFPSFIDLLIGSVFLGPSYSPTAEEALTDKTTTIIYNFYISAILVFFYYFSKISRKNFYDDFDINLENVFSKLRKYQTFIWLGIFLPLILAFTSADVEFYSKYVHRDRNSTNFLQGLATKLSVISVICISLFLSERIYRYKQTKNLFYLVIIIVLLLFIPINSYIHGKRSIVALFLFVSIGVMYVTEVVSRRTLVKVIASTAIFFYFFLQLYGKNIDTSGSLLEMMKGLRIDFSRDYTLKFVIYYDILNEKSVLPYAGASYLFLLTFFIPRDMWSDKPFPYAVYVTNSFFGDFGGNYLYGWGLTTSFVSEAVSNLGYFGLLLFPVFYVYFLRKADMLNVLGLRVFAYLIMTLLLIIHPVAIMTLILLFFMFLLLSKFRIVIKRS